MEETAEGQPRAHIIGMTLEKFLVVFFHPVQALLDAQATGRVALAAARRAGRARGIRPFFNFLHRRVVLGLQLAELLFDGIVGVGDADRKAGFLLHQVADRGRRIGGNQGGQ